MSERRSGLSRLHRVAGTDIVRDLSLDEEAERTGDQIAEEALRERAEPDRRRVVTERRPKILQRASEQRAPFLTDCLGECTSHRKRGELREWARGRLVLELGL